MQEPSKLPLSRVGLAQANLSHRPYRQLPGLQLDALTGVHASLFGYGSGWREDLPIGAGMPSPARGGLSGWQRRRVADFIEDHLTEVLRLSTLAAQVDLSLYHFARAFKQSFGASPHRHHMLRRIERAKQMLTEPSRSVTTIALQLGFAETSSFSATFRRLTGSSPRAYRRALP